MKRLSTGNNKNYQVLYDADEVGINAWVTHDQNGRTGVKQGNWIDVRGFDRVTLMVYFNKYDYPTTTSLRWQIEFTTDPTGSDGWFQCHTPFRSQYVSYIAGNHVLSPIFYDVNAANDARFAVDVEVNAPYMRISNLEELVNGNGYAGDAITIEAIAMSTGRG